MPDNPKFAVSQCMVAEALDRVFALAANAAPSAPPNEEPDEDSRPKEPVQD